MAMGKRLEGKIAVITGACSAIGRAAAELFIAEGARVLAADEQEEAGAQLAKRFGDKLRFTRCDVGRLDELRQAIDSAVAAFGGLDILVAHGGRVGTTAGVQAFNAEAWDDSQHQLLRSVVAGASFAVPHMVRRGGGVIINISPGSALQAGPVPLASSVANAGVLHFTQAAATELAPLKIRMNAVVPSHGPHRAGPPDDIAETALFLASDATRFVTGIHLSVDGGLILAHRRGGAGAGRKPAAT